MVIYGIYYCVRCSWSARTDSLELTPAENLWLGGAPIRRSSLAVNHVAGLVPPALMKTLLLAVVLARDVNPHRADDCCCVDLTGSARGRSDHHCSTGRRSFKRPAIPISHRDNTRCRVGGSVCDQRDLCDNSDQLANLGLCIECVSSNRTKLQRAIPFSGSHCRGLPRHI